MIIQRLFDAEGGTRLRSLIRAVFGLLVTLSIVPAVVVGPAILLTEAVFSFGQYLVAGKAAAGGEPNP